MADHRKEEEEAADVHTFRGRFPTPTDEEADAIVLKGCVPLCTTLRQSWKQSHPTYNTRQHH